MWKWPTPVKTRLTEKAGLSIPPQGKYEVEWLKQRNAD